VLHINNFLDGLLFLKAIFYVNLKFYRAFWIVFLHGATGFHGARDCSGLNFEEIFLGK
jgi:hypothetical protein